MTEAVFLPGSLLSDGAVQLKVGERKYRYQRAIVDSLDRSAHHWSLSGSFSHIDLRDVMALVASL